jgi:hypothetical protein
VAGSSIAPAVGAWPDWISAIATVLGLTLAAIEYRRVRKEQRSEREEVKRQQARLVSVTDDCSEMPPVPESGAWYATVKNNSDAPIYDIEVRVVQRSLDRAVQAVTLSSTPGIFTAESIRELAGHSAEQVVMDVVDEIPNPRPHVEIEFSDAFGVRWVRTADELPLRVIRHSAPTA